MDKNADMSFIISITGYGTHTINLGLIALAVFMLGIVAGILIHYYLSKLPMNKLVAILIISIVSSICYLLEVFGKLSSFLHYLKAIFT